MNVDEFTVKDEEVLLRALQFARASGYYRHRALDVAISMLEDSITQRKGRGE